MLVVYRWGRIVEIYGPESSGKTTLTLELIAAAQKVVGKNFVKAVDAEHALDPILRSKAWVLIFDALCFSN
ncbi:DNA recombination/repair protein RecA [Vibrio chagasii]|nr:DNA recombination/repair protein RecA [Vibrio chagasii]